MLPKLKLQIKQSRKLVSAPFPVQFSLFFYVESVFEMDQSDCPSNLLWMSLPSLSSRKPLFLKGRAVVYQWHREQENQTLLWTHERFNYWYATYAAKPSREHHQQQKWLFEGFEGTEQHRSGDTKPTTTAEIIFFRDSIRPFWSSNNLCYYANNSVSEENQQEI